MRTCELCVRLLINRARKYAKQNQSTPSFIIYALGTYRNEVSNFNCLRILSWRSLRETILVLLEDILITEASRHKDPNLQPKTVRAHLTVALSLIEFARCL